MVEGDGFEPSKAEPADLQSAPFGHSGTPPRGLRITYSLSRHLTDVFPTHQSRISLTREYGGGGRIRTIEGGAGRFTVCSLWPLGNPSRGLRITYSLSRHLTDVFPTHQSRISLTREYGGGGRIRTIEGGAGRFTVCSLWPLGNPSRGLRITYSLSRHLTDVFPTHQSRISLTREYGGGGRIRTIEGGAGRFTVCSLWPLGNPSKGLRINSIQSEAESTFSQRIAQLRSAYYQTRPYCKPFFDDFELNAGFLGRTWQILRFIFIMLSLLML